MKIKPEVKTKSQNSAKSQCGFGQVDFIVRQNIPDWRLRFAWSTPKNYVFFKWLIDSEIYNFSCHIRIFGLLIQIYRKSFIKNLGKNYEKIYHND